MMQSTAVQKTKEKHQEPLIKIVCTQAAATPKLLKACSIFGLGVRSAPPKRVCEQQLRLVLQSTREAGAIVHLGGPSGCGKSTLLRACVRALREQGRCVVIAGRPALDPESSLIDAIPGQKSDALAALSAAGLADAMLLPRCIAELSEGQRARAQIAAALAQARQSQESELANQPASQQPTVIVIDECASTLDAHTAWSLCVSLRKAAASRGFVLLCASARSDVAGWLKTTKARGPASTHATNTAGTSGVVVRTKRASPHAREGKP